MNNWFPSSFNSHCLDNLLKCPFDLTRQNKGVWASITHFQNLVITVLLSPHFSAFCLSEFLIFLLTLPQHHLSHFMCISIFPFLWFGHQSIWCQRCSRLIMKVYLCAAYATLLCRCWTKGKEPGVLDHLIHVFTKKCHSNFLWISVYSSDSNGINKHTTNTVFVVSTSQRKSVCAKCICACFRLQRLSLWLLKALFRV